MAEGKLIRSMTLAVAIAKSSRSEISQSLIDRAAAETDMVRRGVLRLMADKRFLDTVSPVMMWQTDATDELEAFADRLESERAAGYLTDERVSVLIEEFFSVWSALMRNRKHIYESSRKARKKAKMDLAGKSLANISDSEEISEDNDKEGDMGVASSISELHNFLADNDDIVDDITGIGSTDPKLEQQRRENIYLRSIPESLKKLALLIGRANEEVTETRGRFSVASKSDIEGITIGNDLSALLPSEVVLLAEKATQDVFFRNFAEKRLQVFASASQSSRPDDHKDGPVIICVDESSSMSGEPLEVAIKLAYAVTIIAKRRHRDVLIVAYSDSYKMMRVDSLGKDRRQLLKFLSNVSMGGNDENAMFEWLFRDILPKEEKFDTADILCVSDFGWTEIDRSVKGLIYEQKASGMKFYGLNICGAFGGWDSLYDRGFVGPMDVCDSIWEYSNGECVEVKVAIAR
ncbi:MAG TPA: hypothetical protein DDX40_09470 [Rikenellaceae bacterium]|nr:hypothetical protein [Rikenellaceae bacterium]